jgi:chaperonin GroES
VTLSTLQSYIGQINITDKVDEDTLVKIAERVISQYHDDFDSMADWAEYIDKGIEVAKQELTSRSQPWDGASNYKTSLLTEASMAFGDRVSVEVLRQKNLVKFDVIGSFNDEERKKAKEDRGKRVTDYMNYQLNYEDKDWRDKQERLFYELPNYGTMFKKTYFDPVLGRNRSVKLHYPNWAVNQATEDLETCRSFTEVCDFSMNEAFEMVAAGVWEDPFTQEEEKAAEDNVDEGKQLQSNESEEVEQAVDNEERYFEQRTFYDLDGDGYEEPYIITVHERTKKVVRIIPRYDEASIRIKDNDGKVTTLAKVQAKAAMDKQEPSFEGYTLVAIRPWNDITKYPFIPATDGTFLDVGFYHLLTAMSMVLNSNTNMLMDAGALANQQGGLMARGVRKKMGDIRVEAGKYKSTEIDAQDLATGIRDWNFKEPSPTLIALKDSLDAQARRMIATIDSGALQANTPATTALAIVQEQLLPVTSILLRVLRAQGDEFKLMYDLNFRYLEDEHYQEVIDSDEASYEEDFAEAGLDIQPTANAEMSSKFQRIQQAIAGLEQLPALLQAGGNPAPVVRSFYDAIGWNPEEIFPPVDPEKEKADAEQQRAIQMAPIELQKAQILALSAEVARGNSKTRSENVERASKVLGNITKAVLTLEQAETEAVTNQISTYTEELGSLLSGITQTTEVENELNRQTERMLVGGAATTANNAGKVPALEGPPSNQTVVEGNLQ